MREINVITPTYIPAHHYTYISAHLHDCGHLMAGGRQKCLLWVGGQLLVDGSSSILISIYCRTWCRRLVVIRTDYRKKVGFCNLIVWCIKGVCCPKICNFCVVTLPLLQVFSKHPNETAECFAPL